MYRIFITEPAVTPVALARTQTKLPVKFALKIVVLRSVVNVVPAISNQSDSVGVVANDPCILTDPVSVANTWYATVCTPSACE